MNTVTRRFGLVAMAIGALSNSAYSQKIPTIYLQIVEHNGLPPANPTTLSVQPGDELVIDVLAKEWSPAGEKARSFEISLDLDSLSSGLTGSISPKKGNRPCSSTAECTDISGFSSCVGGFCITSKPDMAGVLVDRNRVVPVPWIFLGFNNIGGLSTVFELKFGFLLTSSGQSPVYVSPRYLGTFVLIVSDDASGCFDIELLAFPSSTLNDAATTTSIAATTGGLCNIDADCTPEEVCFLRTNAVEKVCVTALTQGVTIRSDCGDGVVGPGEECDDGGESATCDVNCTLAACGDSTANVTAGEACDGGLGCTGCLCDADFESTVPPSLDCQLICGNGVVDSGEACDGGLGCTDCSCDLDFEPTVPPSIDCVPICGNGVIDPGEECDDGGETATCNANCMISGCGDGALNENAGEECDGGIGCTNCLCDEDFAPTVPPSIDCLQAQFIERAISMAAVGYRSVFAADVDGDGDTDVLSASSGDHTIAWYENDGARPPSFTERVISTTASAARSVFAADLDDDGDIDILSASSNDNKIAWYENDGASPPTFTERVISLNAAGAFSVFAIDVNGDGDTDVLSASVLDNRITWYENSGGSNPSFTPHVIAIDAFDTQTVFAVDLDRDGDTDIISGSRGNDRISWYVNSGGPAPSFANRAISGNADFVVSVFAADLDGDGDTDVLSASTFDNKIAWYENAGNTTPSFNERVISTNATGASAVFAADVDGDGDIDVLSASSFDNKIAWYENVGGFGPTFIEREISTTANGALSVFAADMDRDGDIDILSASFSKIAWYENTTPRCENRRLEPGEECDGGLGCTDCVCDADFERTTPTSFDCQPICGNGRVDEGEVCDGMNDSACPDLCLADCSCDLFCGDGTCDAGENTCNCPSDCGSPLLSESPGSTCSDGLDNDCDGLIDFDDPDCVDQPIPTVSRWGLIVMLLLLLTGIKVTFGRREALRG